MSLKPLWLGFEYFGLGCPPVVEKKTGLKVTNTAFHLYMSPSNENIMYYSVVLTLKICLTCATWNVSVTFSQVGKSVEMAWLTLKNKIHKN